MSLSWVETVRRVIARAKERCEYCQMHQALQGATFHVEHIVPSSAGGSDDLDNLCLACPSCNLSKSDRVTVPDPDSGAEITFFNPRLDEWNHHFNWHGFQIVGTSALGRAMVAALDLNSPRRLLIREAEAAFELFPPSGES